MCNSHAEYSGISHKAIFGPWINDPIFREVGTPNFDYPFVRLFSPVTPAQVKPQLLAEDLAVSGEATLYLGDVCLCTRDGNAERVARGHRGTSKPCPVQGQSAPRQARGDSEAPAWFWRRRIAGLREVTWYCNTVRAESAWFSETHCS